MRGATFAVKRLLETVQNPTRLTVVTHSSGNHAQALALASSLLHVSCHVVMPSNAPQVKKDAVFLSASTSNAIYNGLMCMIEQLRVIRPESLDPLEDFPATQVQSFYWRHAIERMA